MDVDWIAPQIGRTSVPLGIDGPGTLEWSQDGLRLRGRLHSKHAASLGGCLGFFVTFGLVVLLGVAFKLTSEALYLLPLAGLFVGLRIARAVFPAREVELHVPWSQVKKLRVDSREVQGNDTVAFHVDPGVFSFKPKGAVYFRPVSGTCMATVEAIDTARPGLS